MVVPVVIIQMEPTEVAEVTFLQEHQVLLVVAQAEVMVVLVVLQEMVTIALGILLVVVRHGEEVEMARLVLTGLRELVLMSMTDQIAIALQRLSIFQMINLLREQMALAAAVAAVEAEVRKAQHVLVLEVLSLEATEAMEAMEEPEVSGVPVVLAVVETSELTSIIA